MAAILSASRSIRSASLLRTNISTDPRHSAATQAAVLTNTTLRSRVGPPLALEGGTGSLDGAVDIRLARLGDGHELLAGRGVDGVEGLAVGGLDPLVVAGISVCPMLGRMGTARWQISPG